MERTNENSRDFQEKLIEEKDKISPSPSIRARAIWDILNTHDPRPTLWDLVCFGIEVLTLAAESYPFITYAVRGLNHLIYATHYNAEGLFDSFVVLNQEEKKENGD